MTKKPQLEEDVEEVLPRTLGIRPLTYAAGETKITVSGVYGGRDGSVWCATFYDEPEAQAWIIACNQFGQPVRGIKTGAADGPRIDSGESARKPN
jgi:hypothetical protein